MGENIARYSVKLCNANRDYNYFHFNIVLVVFIFHFKIKTIEFLSLSLSQSVSFFCLSYFTSSLSALPFYPFLSIFLAFSLCFLVSL